VRLEQRLKNSCFVLWQVLLTTVVVGGGCEQIARVFDSSSGFLKGRVSRFLEDVPAELPDSATLQESEVT
jgi:hypothetical protein